MKLECSGISDIGKTRKNNQDAFCMYHRDDAGLFAVADGMGGYLHGEKASQAVIEALSKWWDSFSPDSYACDFSSMISSIEHAIDTANRRIYTQLNQDGICGTTIVVLFLYQHCYGVLYAGDSRCYVKRGFSVKSLTVDEVWENQPGISSQERRQKQHPDRGKLTNAVGVLETVRCRILTDYVSDGMCFLLCSDGLYKFCEERFLKKCIRQAKNMHSMEQAIQKLLDRVYKNGAADNITMVLIRIC